MYGIVFDPGLYMEEAIDRLCSEASWKLNSILRTSRYFDAPHIVYVYKTKVMSYIEFRTTAIYHSSDTLLQRVDAIQNRLLRSLGIEELDMLEYVHLAPLRTRRDIAMLGIIHRTILELGPEHFRKFFKLSTEASPDARNS